MIKMSTFFMQGLQKLMEKFYERWQVLNSTVSLPSMKASRDRAIELLNQVVWEINILERYRMEVIK